MQMTASVRLSLCLVVSCLSTSTELGHHGGVWSASPWVRSKRSPCVCLRKARVSPTFTQVYAPNFTLKTHANNPRHKSTLKNNAKIHAKIHATIPRPKFTACSLHQSLSHTKHLSDWPPLKPSMAQAPFRPQAGLLRPFASKKNSVILAPTPGKTATIAAARQSARFPQMREASALGCYCDRYSFFLVPPWFSPCSVIALVSTSSVVATTVCKDGKADHLQGHSSCDSRDCGC